MTEVIQDPRPRPPRLRDAPVLFVAVAIALGSVFVALLWVSSYAKVRPTLAGFPFFYWYSLLWLVISTAAGGAGNGAVEPDQTSSHMRTVLQQVINLQPPEELYEAERAAEDEKLWREVRRVVEGQVEYYERKTPHWRVPRWRIPRRR